MKKQLIVLHFFCASFLQLSAQMKMMPEEFRIGQKFDSLHLYSVFKDSIRLKSNSDYLKTFYYKNEKFKNILSDNDIISTTFLIDSLDNVGLIQIIFKCYNKDYFDSLRKYLPKAPATMETMGREDSEGKSQIFETIIRYKQFFISIALNGKGELYTTNAYNSQNSIILTIGNYPFISVKRL